MKHDQPTSVLAMHPSTVQVDDQAPADWLDQLLHDQAAQAVAVPEDDFSARVLQALPPAPALRQRRRWDPALVLQLISAMAVGIALALLMLVMPEAVNALAQMGPQLEAQGLQVLAQGATLQPVVLVLVLGLGVVWWSWQQAID
jgi:hypothetical protein